MKIPGRKIDSAIRRSLAAGWRCVFGDSDEYIGRFYDAFLPHIDLYCEVVGETVVSAFHLLPHTLRLAGKTYQAPYLYAAFTLAEYEGRGIMSSLIRDAISDLKAGGIPLMITLPASDSLYGYYARFGFSPAFELYDIAVPRETLRSHASKTDSVPTPPDSVLIEKAYAAYLETTALEEGAVVKPDYNFYYTASDVLRSGGKVFAVGDSYAFVLNMDFVLVKECRIAPALIPDFFSFLLESFPEADSFTFRLRPGGERSALTAALGQDDKQPIRTERVRAGMLRITSSAIFDKGDVTPTVADGIGIANRENSSLPARNFGVHPAESVADAVSAILSGAHSPPYMNMMFD